MTKHDTTAIRAQMEALEGHAPGPWTARKSEDWSDPGISVRAGGKIIADIGWGSTIGPDARLIAAAPDMRAAIIALCDAVDARDTELARLREALQKDGEI